MDKDVELKIQIILCHLLLILNCHPPLSSSLGVFLPPCVLGLGYHKSCGLFLTETPIYLLNLCLCLQVWSIFLLLNVTVLIQSANFIKISSK